MASENKVPSLTNSGSPTRCAIYTRYTSDMQRRASLEDQERECRRAAALHGWVVLDDFVRGDSAVSGKSTFDRDALNSLITDAKKKPRPFDRIVIDDMSRLGRNFGDILKIDEVLQHHGVLLYFVGEQLDTGNPMARAMLTLTGLQAEQFIEGLRAKVHRGQEGRVRNGLTSGSRIFGYRSVPVLDPSRTSEHDRAATLGARLEVVESQAEIVRRIFSLFADGRSIAQIMGVLNQEGIPATGKAKVGSAETAWNPTLIKRILSNEKYNGINVWNRRYYRQHPETGKVKTLYKSADEVLRVDAPELRIVSPELWNRVQERLACINEKFKRCRLGGLNRSPRKEYLFSGLMKCGVCGDSIVIVGGGGPRSIPVYGCRNHKYKRGCSNKLTIRHDRLTGQLMQALSTRIFEPQCLEYLINSVTEELNCKLQNQKASDGRSALNELLQRKSSLQDQIARLIDALMHPVLSQSPGLHERLAETEIAAKAIDQEIAAARYSKPTSISQEAIRDLIIVNVQNLLAVAQGDVLKARQVLQQHIERLILFPVETPAGPRYEVFGDINLFSATYSEDSGVMLDQGSTRSIQHYRSLFQFSFVGLQLNPRSDTYTDEDITADECLAA
jgi:site-specific DNA recombinase